MKIAVITDDGLTISQHFGRARYYLVCTIEDNRIVKTEMREKAGHHSFAHDHDHAHAHHDHQNAEQGHGFGSDSGRKHAAMIEPIVDCEALLVRGMGRGAYLAVEAANVKPVVTDMADIEQAVKAYLSGDLANHIEKLH
jgi:predicted Fe-Mo cluster-binding NifX family protein